MVFYYGLWTLVFYFLHDKTRRFCGAANAGLIVYALGLFVVYFVATSVYFFTTRDQPRRTDYRLAVLLTFIPLIVGICDLLV